MIWLILSILCSSLIFVAFKSFERYRVSNLQAIVVNYFVAFSVGLLGGEFDWHAGEVLHKPWFSSTLILGIIFISLFQLMALVSQRWGVSAVSVAVKMSLVIPVVFAIWRYHESLGIIKLSGIIAALLAVYFATRKPEKTKRDWRLAFLPLLLFLGSGFLDAFLAYNQNELVPEAESAYFSSQIFLMAGIMGVLWFAIAWARKRQQPQWRAIWGGIALGIPNYGSIYFLLRALGSNNLGSSVIFPINNVGIVLLSVILGRLLFSEKISTINLAGIILAMLAIGLMTIAK